MYCCLQLPVLPQSKSAEVYINTCKRIRSMDSSYRSFRFLTAAALLALMARCGERDAISALLSCTLLACRKGFVADMLRQAAGKKLPADNHIVFACSLADEWCNVVLQGPTNSPWLLPSDETIKAGGSSRLFANLTFAILCASVLQLQRLHHHNGYKQGCKPDGAALTPWTLPADLQKLAEQHGVPDSEDFTEQLLNITNNTPHDDFGTVGTPTPVQAAANTILANLLNSGQLAYSINLYANSTVSAKAEPAVSCMHTSRIVVMRTAPVSWLSYLLAILCLSRAFQCQSAAEDRQEQVATIDTIV